MLLLQPGQTIERRSVVNAPALRSNGEVRTAVGYAALFNSPTDIGGMFREVIAPGAFTETLKTADVRALIDHDSGRVIGRRSAGTLRLKTDATGLAVEIDLPDNTEGRDLAVSLARGDISGMSFGFIVLRDQWDDTSDLPRRTIQAVELFEVSAVAFPAFSDTSIGLRSPISQSASDRRLQIAARRAEMNMRIAGIKLSDQRYI